MSTTRTAPYLFDLLAHADRVAVVTEEETLTYADLAQRAASFAAEVLGPSRRLVLLEASNTVSSLVAYLAAVQHGHVALLVPDGRPGPLEAMVAAYDPDVVVHSPAGGRTPEAVPRRPGSAHDLHPDLALLLSTSGSTGSPKLVRISRDNLRSNAESIAAYLGLTPDDRAVTTLPLHYCYGLSVVNSHLAVGAGLVLTEGSVVDECFWELAARAGGTSFAAVPYTFELLERSGFDERSLPSLRYVTQAGGRLAPDQVRRWAATGRRAGWELVVMYGQTEATARMAYLPPDLVEARPAAIGVPIPGGSLRLEPVPEAGEPDVGELVYRGPNVMMGYAAGPADLVRGAEVEELRTGDLARCVDGVFEVVGRRRRSVKLFGLRIDLDHVEATLARDAPGTRVAAVTHDGVLHLFATGRVTGLRARLAEACGLPVSAVLVWRLDDLPSTPNGKVDYPALERRAALARRRPGTRAGRPTVTELCEEYALVLGRSSVSPEDTFVGLGADSLSYVELATRLGSRIGDLPPDWHTRPVRDLVRPPATGAPEPTPARRRSAGVGVGVLVDTSVLLRALAIVAIVGSHANLLAVTGGAHLLLAVAGHNFARFQLGGVPGAARLRSGLAALAQVVVPSVVVTGVLVLTTGFYDAPTAVLLNGLLGSDTWDVDWQLWFLEALVWTTLAALLLTAVPVVGRWERRAPWTFSASLLALTLAVRFGWTGVEAGPTERYTVGVVAWCFVLGWCAARAVAPGERAVVTLAAVAATVGFFGDLQRELVVVAGVAALVWLPTVRVPRLVLGVLRVLAGSSLYVYLLHWQVYPHLEVEHPLLATVASFAVGLAAWRLAREPMRVLRRALSSH